MQPFEIKFFKKQKRLFAAVEKYKKLHIKYLKQLHNNTIKFDFNLLYDLEYRLIDRIKELQDNYFEDHYAQYDFNCYSL